LNDIDRGKPKNSEKNLSQCHLVYHKSHWIDLGANPGLRDERPGINRLSYGTAYESLKTGMQPILKKVTNSYIKYTSDNGRCPT
jgi:hypothetical protein